MHAYINYITTYIIRSRCIRVSELSCLLCRWRFHPRCPVGSGVKSVLVIVGWVVVVGTFNTFVMAFQDTSIWKVPLSFSWNTTCIWNTTNMIITKAWKCITKIHNCELIIFLLIRLSMLKTSLDVHCVRLWTRFDLMGNQHYRYSLSCRKMPFFYSQFTRTLLFLNAMIVRHTWYAVSFPSVDCL